MSAYKFIEVSVDSHFWDQAIKIYDDSFPAWEKEDIQNISAHIKTSRYKMIAYLSHNEVHGFYIFDTNQTLDYTHLTFLAVKEGLRGKKIGSKLCLNAIDYFHKHMQCQWLLIEAEDRQAKLYGKLGFKKILFDYSLPEFNSKESVPMHLLCINKGKDLDNPTLKNIIKNIFIFGYDLDEKDKRLQNQLNEIPLNIKTIDW